MLLEAEEDRLAFHAFAAAHRSKLRSTNALRACQPRGGRRTDVIEIFPNDRSLIRLAGVLLVEHNDD